MELTKEHWEKCKQDNINLILQCKMQIPMAEKIITLADEKMAEFPDEEEEQK